MGRTRDTTTPMLDHLNVLMKYSALGPLDRKKRPILTGAIMMRTLGDAESPIDFEMLFDRRVAQSYYGVEPEPTGTVYDDDRGLFVKTEVNGGRYIQDLIQFAPDALAFTGAGDPFPVPNASHHCQVVSNGDWIHLCLRLGSSGFESISGRQLVDQPSKICSIVRYPSNTQIVRTSRSDDSWRMACLWLRPAALLRMLETSSSRVPAELSWLTAEKIDTAHHLSIGITPKMQMAVNDVLGSDYKGGIRRAFVFSKYLELLTGIYQSATEIAQDSKAYLAEKDMGKLQEVANILQSNLDRMESLATLARHVGMSRTKLISGFKAVYGSSVESYWRDCRMQQATELLRNQRLSIGDVAHQVGYAEVSSFTKAYSRHFGFAPTTFRTRRPFSS